MSQYTEIEELEIVLTTQDLLDLHWWKQRRATTTDTSKWGTRTKSQEAKVKFKYTTLIVKHGETPSLSFCFN